MEQVKKQAMTGATLTDDFWANDILCPLCVFTYNLLAKWRVHHKNDKFKRQKYRTFIDWFIAEPSKITRSGHQTEIKQRKEEIMKTNSEVYGRGTFH